MVAAVGTDRGGGDRLDFVAGANDGVEGGADSDHVGAFGQDVGVVEEAAMAANIGDYEGDAHCALGVGCVFRLDLVRFGG